ncbi:signal peptidase II [Pedobacter sp. LMG 31464]|uniref:Lipoprotein signal peptidase n=1 Tax=Pedobacter planticolens TaxID=2679964 RepID=A0A923E396_9SPHI|nr:signal peptidase II [Pedobacter planticolens]MBB2146709.1 signal peptidase II [Pedobacter planticolens]
MQKKETLRWILLLAIVALNIGCDQVSKSIVRQKIDYDENISIIKNHFILTKVENTGAFLSAGNNLPEAVRFVLLSILPVLVLGYGLFYLLSKNNLPRSIQLGLCFLIGGGIGNVYDRILFGSVTDFLHMDFGIFRTGIFNLADVSIMIGIALLFIQSLKRKISNPSPVENNF